MGGVANSVGAFVERRRVTIAILKSLGASGSRAVAIMLCEVAMLAGAGIVIGVIGGAALPFAVVMLFGEVLPAPVLPGPFYRSRSRHCSARWSPPPSRCSR